MIRDRFGNLVRESPASFANWKRHPQAQVPPERHGSRAPLDADPLVPSPNDVVPESAPGGMDAGVPHRPPAPSLTDLRDELRSAMAEVEATRLRLLREAVRAQLSTRTDLLVALVPVLDNLDRTLAVSSADRALVQGVEMVRAQLEGVLAGYGLEPIVAVGARFNPAEHEAVATVPVERLDQDGVVHDAISRGYRFDGRVLVPARVRVGRMTSPRGTA